jgi:multicomponent Na+:H+ antiporter subunit B
VGLLAYGTLGLPEFGSPDSVIHKHVAPRYLKEGPTETGVPNIVTAVLASYRGFDTLGEVGVIFTAGIGVIVLLRRRWRSDVDEKDT